MNETINNFKPFDTIAGINQIEEIENYILCITIIRINENSTISNIVFTKCVHLISSLRSNSFINHIPSRKREQSFTHIDLDLALIEAI